MAYLSTPGIEACLQYLSTTFPSICQLIVLPEFSIEGRTSRAVRIGKGGGHHRHGVLLIGGVHARELVNPDTLVGWALDLCQAYTSGSGLSFGPKVYDKGVIKLLVEALDIFVFPLVNPDGRVHVQSPAGDPWWRKNRNPNPGQPCKGVDLNRNYDFLWSSGIGTSAAACSDVFKGSAAFSEPETRNVRSLLQGHPHIDCMMDVHSYSELVLFPWGDDENQNIDPAMNFQNPAYNGLRGTAGDALYREYMPTADADWFQETGERVRDAIAAVRGRVYTVQQSIYLYPTSGTAHDYGYSRHLVDAGTHKVFAYTLETGREFQPASAEASQIMEEVSSGLTEFCIACLCVVDSATTFDKPGSFTLDRLRRFRDKHLATTPAGRRYLALLQRHSGELLNQVFRNRDTRTLGLDLVREVSKLLPDRGKKGRPVPASLIRLAERLLKSVHASASPSLRKAIAEVRQDLKFFEGKPIIDGLTRRASGRKSRTG